jgi:TRAP-type C4-dicarboxylate transport system substrate-binding protein
MTNRLFSTTALLVCLASATAMAADFTVRFATIAPEGTPWSEQLLAMQGRITRESGGRIDFKLYMGGQLGGEVETLASLKRGRIQGWGGSTAALATVLPALEVIELPFLFNNDAEVDHVLDTVLFDDMRARLAAKGLVLASWNENGWRSVGTRGKAVRRPADLAGLKVRSQQSKLHLKMWQAFGANAVPLSLPEVLSALQTGVVNAFDNSPLFAAAASWHTAIDHFTLTEHMYQAGAVVYSQRLLQELPPDLQKILLGDPLAEAQRGRAGVRTLTPEILAIMRDARVAVIQLTPEERDTWRRLALPLHDAHAEVVGRDLLEKVRTALREYRSQ